MITPVKLGVWCRGRQSYTISSLGNDHRHLAVMSKRSGLVKPWGSLPYLKARFIQVWWVNEGAIAQERREGKS